MMRSEVPEWPIDPENLKMPETLVAERKAAENGNSGDKAAGTEEKSYQIEMDRLNEIITNK